MIHRPPTYLKSVVPAFAARFPQAFFHPAHAAQADHPEDGGPRSGDHRLSLPSDFSFPASIFF